MRISFVIDSCTIELALLLREGECISLLFSCYWGFYETFTDFWTDLSDFFTLCMSFTSFVSTIRKGTLLRACDRSDLWSRMGSFWVLFLTETYYLFRFRPFLLLWASWWTEISLATDLVSIGLSWNTDTALLFLDGDGTSLSFYDALTDACLECLSIIDFGLTSLWMLLTSSFFLISTSIVCSFVSSLGG